MTPWLTALIIARALDASSSIVALQNPLLKEGIPWMPSRPVGIVAVQGGITASQIYFLHKLSLKHPKLARGLAVVQIGTGGVAVTLNIRAIRKVR